MAAEIIPFPRQTGGRHTTGRRETSGSPNAGWRAALAELKTSMHALDNSMERYRLRLATLSAELNGVRAQSSRPQPLAARAERLSLRGALATKQSPRSLPQTVRLIREIASPKA